jgi:serine/threonine protein kinase
MAAIKCVHASSDRTISKAELGYAKREIAVLLELSHPNIVQLYSVVFDDNTSDSHVLDIPQGTRTLEFVVDFLRSFQLQTIYKCCLVLSYHSGPTLQQLLDHGGALGYPVAREVAKQLLLAVAYLHGRAVIHRDIKPDNLIVSGTDLNDHLCWSNSVDSEDAIRHNKYHLTLIDFGFARPLHPDDVHVDVGLRNLSNPTINASSNIPSNTDFLLMSIDKPMHISDPDHSLEDKDKIKESVSHHRVADLSALGHRHFAAPEILQNIHKYTRRLSISRDSSRSKHSLSGSMSKSTVVSSSSSQQQSTQKTIQSSMTKLFRSKKPSKEHTIPLSEHVSTYGMVADAYSVGAVLRYILTGCPPQVSTSTYISQQNSPLNLLGQGMGSLLRRSSSRMNKEPDGTIKDGVILPRKKQFRYQQDLPEEVRFLILGLTHFDPQKRTSVRSALGSSWFGSTIAPPTQRMEEPVSFLHCVLEGYV